MELLLLVDAAKRASAHYITAVVPYFGFARSDRKDKPRVAIAAKLVANLLQTAGITRIMTMDLHAGQRIDSVPVDVVFIGSCTNSRLEDLRAAARIVEGRHVASGVRALVVPGSGIVRRMAEEEGLDRILLEAGFEWREPCCSMCASSWSGTPVMRPWPCTSRWLNFPPAFQLRTSASKQRCSRA